MFRLSLFNSTKDIYNCNMDLQKYLFSISDSKEHIGIQDSKDLVTEFYTKKQLLNIINNNQDICDNFEGVRFVNNTIKVVSSELFIHSDNLSKFISFYNNTIKVYTEVLNFNFESRRRILITYNNSSFCLDFSSTSNSNCRDKVIINNNIEFGIKGFKLNSNPYFIEAGLIQINKTNFGFSFIFYYEPCTYFAIDVDTYLNIIRFHNLDKTTEVIESTPLKYKELFAKSKFVR